MDQLHLRRGAQARLSMHRLRSAAGWMEALVTAGGLDPTPPNPGAAPLDVAAIRAKAAKLPGLTKGGYVGDRADEVAADACALCDALERERKVSAAWKALAKAERDMRHFRVRSDEEYGAAMRRRNKAEADLRALGIDPDADPEAP